MRQKGGKELILSRAGNLRVNVIDVMCLFILFPNVTKKHSRNVKGKLHKGMYMCVHIPIARPPSSGKEAETDGICKEDLSVSTYPAEERRQKPIRYLWRGVISGVLINV